MATGASSCDLARFGMESARPVPRQADLMIVAGRCTRTIAPVLQRLYNQMAEPKWVIAMGKCASTGGLFNKYAVVQGMNEMVPVDMYVADCPRAPKRCATGS